MSTRSDELKHNLAAVRSRIADAAASAGRHLDEINLIVVTKTLPLSDVEILYELGVRDFGENRDQEGSAKAPQMPADVTWHFQGQIQSNKLKSISLWADLIHSLDEIRHAMLIDSLSPGKSVLIQISLDTENENRGGVKPTELQEFVNQLTTKTQLDLRGFMAVGPLGQAPLTAFSRLREIVKDFPKYPVLSAGMSNDFIEAISMGATHVRIGSQILGVR